jgi:hypothetical protein
MPLSDERAREVLTGWANLHINALMEPRSINARLVSRYPEFFADALGAEIAGDQERWIAGVQVHLRGAWEAARDPWERDWYIVKLREIYGNAVSRHRHRSNLSIATSFERLSLSPDNSSIAIANSVAGLAQRLRSSGMTRVPPPPRTRFDDLMRWFQKHARHARCCPREGCQTRYFFKAEEVRTQTYCGEDCKREARLESEKNYWHRTGKHDREEQRKRHRRQRQAKKRRVN